MSANVALFLEVLPTLGLGYVSIFIVTAIIIACITVLNKVTSKMN